MNKVYLHGNVGKDPDIHAFEAGKKVAKFSLATSEYSKDKDGNRVTTATWHTVVAWDKLAEIVEKHITKGSSLIIEGKISYRSYDDKDGKTKYYTEIIAREIHFTGSKPAEKPAEVKKTGDVEADIRSGAYGGAAEDDPSYDPFAYGGVPS